MMKRIPLLLHVCFALCGISSLHAQTISYDRLWLQVEQAEKKSLPQTVVKLADEIFRKAEAEKNSPQMLKAYTRRTKYQESLTPDSFYVHLSGLEQWAHTGSKPTDKAILHSLLAEMYADYAAKNRWELRRRTSVENEIPADIREWSSNIFTRKVIEHTRATLQNTLNLLDTSSKAYIPFVTTGETSVYYGHDMYHLLALRAITALERVSTGNEESEIDNEINNIYTNLIDTYQKRDNPEAVLLATLSQLDRLDGKPDNESNIDNSFNRLIAENESREICAEVYLMKAKRANGRLNYTDAVRLCDEAIAKYPRYKRINALKNLRMEIMNPSLTVNAKGIEYPGEESELKVSHRNLTGFTVIYYQVNLPATSPLLNKVPDASFRKAYCKKTASHHLTVISPEDHSYQDTTLTLKAPQEGIYLMQVVPDDKTGTTTENFLSVTKFKALTRSLPDKQYEVAVLDAVSGKPVPDAIVRFFTEEKGETTEIKSLTAGTNGKVQLPWNDTYKYITIEKGKDTTMMQSIYRGYYSYSSDDNRSRPRVQLLTDRALYRPGQTVYLKGIAYNMQADTAHVISGKAYTVKLLDANNRETGRKEVQTNDFGSFTTQFVLPSGGLNGTYYINTGNESISIRVEEYKRPTFDITFSPQEGTYQLGDSVQVKGLIKAYSGAIIREVPVQYTVTRRSYNWWRIFEGNETLLSSGSVELNDAGEFSIPFMLEPDKKHCVDNGYYTYTIEVAATNAAGETQTSQTSIPAGSRSLVLSADMNERISKENPGKVIFSATNLAGKPVSTQGEYKLYPKSGTEPNIITAELPSYSASFTSNEETLLSAWKNLPSGAYKLKLSAKDEQGRNASYEQDIVLFSESDTRPPVETKKWYYPLNTSFDETHPASFIFGTSEKDTYIMADVFSGDKHLESTVLHLSDSIVRFEYPYQKEYGNGLNILFCFVKNKQLYIQEVRLKKRMPDKKLKITREVFRDNLRPGQQEEWKLTIKTPQGNPAVAEMLATMYDSSLDKIWPMKQSLNVSYHLSLPQTYWLEYYDRNNLYYMSFPYKSLKVSSLAYDALLTYPDNFGSRFQSYYGATQEIMIRGTGDINGLPKSRSIIQSKEILEMADVATPALEESALEEDIPLPHAPSGLRTNFSETAFFYPQLRTNEAGEIVFTFTVPESLTRWSFNGYAHTKGMLTGMVNGEVATSKDFMLTANLPRFVRTGDKTSAAAAVTNLTGKQLSGTVTFTLFDPMTEKVIATQKQKFNTEAGQTTGVNFMFTASDKYDILGCRLMAEGGDFSDGEQHLLPVLSNKENITETLAMPVRGKETREFSLASLFNKNSKTATNKRLTVEFTGNPAWYAVQALPALSLPAGDNAVSWAATYYANAAASHIINAQPRIKTIFDAWKLQGETKESFLSNLQKNQDVKDILLEESPWLTEALSETEQMQRIATLFDLNNIQNNNITALTKLKDLQHVDGSWPWYKGMGGSRYVTGFVLKTLIRLSALSGKSPEIDARSMQQSAFRFLHAKALEEYQRIRREEEKGNKITGISQEALQYLYLVAISGEEVPEGNTRKAYNYFLGKITETLTTQSLITKAHAAVVLHKAGRVKEAEAFIASLKEHAVQTDEQGMYFAFNESPYSWAGLKVPAHVSVMEALDITGKNLQAIEEMKLWLLKQKQTQQWNSPVATVDAVHTLLYRGNNLLENQGTVRITVGDKIMEIPSNNQSPTAGLGYIKETITDKNTIAGAKKITVEKRDEGIAWGAVYAQYLENIDNVTPQGKELQVEKKLYVEKIVNNTKQLQPVTSGTKLAIGDKVVSRITIRLDRTMDFVQLKDQRGGCFEPIENVSGYRRSSTTGFYVAVKDASTQFFFDTLSKGVHVLEYGYRVSRAGTYESGLAVIQSAYAPEYAAHTASGKVTVE